jgi:hypothetical protein
MECSLDLPVLYLERANRPFDDPCTPSATSGGDRGLAKVPASATQISPAIVGLLSLKEGGTVLRVYGSHSPRSISIGR